jgi:signal transduction histidine kinase/CheY-like chemotaxis protein
VTLDTSFVAVVTGYDEERRQLILSKKAAEEGPMQRFLAAHQPGDVVEGRVTSVSGGGYELSLEGGVEGWLPNRLVPRLRREEQEGALTSPIHSPLLVNDDVKVCYEGPSGDEGSVTVNLMDFVARLREETAGRIGAILRSRPSGMATQSSAATGATDADAPTPRPLDVLLVEDEGALREQLAAALRARGHRVSAHAELDRRFRRACARQCADVLLLDLQLHDGVIQDVGWVLDLHEHCPELRTYLFTGNLPAFHANGNGRLRSLLEGVIEKPTSVGRIINIIEGALAPRRVEDPDTTADTVGAAGNPVRLPQGWRREVRPFLHAFEETWAGCRSMLVEREPNSQRVELLEETGIVDRGGVAGACRRLVRSVVGHALQDHSVLTRTNGDVPSGDPLGELLATMGKEMVVVLPLPVGCGNRELGVILFGNHGNTSIPTETWTTLERLAEELTLALERLLLDEEVLRQQRATCAGSLLLGMAHELRNSVQTLETYRHNVRTGVSGMARRGDISLPQQLNSDLAGMKAQISGLRDTLEMFLDIVRIKESEQSDLGETIAETVTACVTVARQWNVVLHAVIPSGVVFPTVPNLFRQALMNLLLNAIQQCSHTPAGRGLVELTVQPRELNGERVLDILVQDNGLGIHHTHLDSIFDMFFTTRASGTGLGLYVTQMIIEAMGGRLDVTETWIYGGTTFRIRVPEA